MWKVLRPFAMPVVALAFLLAASALAHAATPVANTQPPPSSASPASAQATIDALARATRAVVGIQVKASEDSRSAKSLGAERNGSGVVIGEDGLVLTIGYLVVEAEQIEIVDQDGKHYPARQVAYDLATGFGLVQAVVPMKVEPVALGSQKELEPGAVLMTAIGAQDDTDYDVSMVQLVGKRAFSGYWEYYIDTALFTSPPIANHSGAPIFNSKGELVGIGSLFVLNAMGDNRRLPGNMFVPVDLLKPILAEMRQTGSSRSSHRPWLGLTSAEQQGRVQVVRVTADGPAQMAGLQPGDVVLAVDGTSVGTLEQFYKQLWARGQPEGDVELTVLQGAEVRKLTVRTVDRMATMAKPGI